NHCVLIPKLDLNQPAHRIESKPPAKPPIDEVHKKLAFHRDRMPGSYRRSHYKFSILPGDKSFTIQRLKKLTRVHPPATGESGGKEIIACERAHGGGGTGARVHIRHHPARSIAHDLKTETSGKIQHLRDTTCIIAQFFIPKKPRFGGDA